VSRVRIAAVTIGQTPRPDLLEPLLARAGEAADAEILELGALDGLAAAAMPSSRDRDRPDGEAHYPLTTRLRDGSRVTIDEIDLAPLVQGALDRADDAGAEVTLLLCAGGFPDATSRHVLIRPFDAGVARLRELGAHRIAVVVPFEGQVEASHRKWQEAGFDVMPLVGAPETLDVPASDGSIDAIVLDYVGHASAAVQQARARATTHVIDLGECGAEAAAEALAGRLVNQAVAAR
jgi:hypothetical protein